MTTDLVVPFSTEEESDKAMDKFIVAILDLHAEFIEMKGWRDIRPTELFEGIWGEIIRSDTFTNTALGKVYVRFRDTNYFINEFKHSKGEEKLRFKKELIRRGIIK